ncbi:protein xpaC [Peribacillus cavernae]|uniref:Protein xpaC n=1 Tax=Peribacillus cavernae TaxID=1674310 RepID=A0A433HA08_9BACI|nr:5-bromo-4-chloroindolyl phosphate hydrolysis family protein [Peribacillus cavernae]RUQ25169.1 protein xpaC [Peribacillus cavernae]
MNPFLAFLVRMFIAIPTTAAVWLVSYFGFNQTFLFSTALSLAGGTLTYWIISVYLKYSFLKRHRLTRKEYRYINENLNEAKQKMTRLYKALISIRHIPSLKQRLELMRITRKIYSLTKKEPRRFYQAERFYFSHLDSAVELTEKYVFLSAQPKKNRELDQSLHETRQTLGKLQHSIEDDLYQILADDIDQLHFELDVAKHSIKTGKNSRLLEEGRR